jgi:hypothetical protein
MRYDSGMSAGKGFQQKNNLLRGYGKKRVQRAFSVITIRETAFL